MARLKTSDVFASVWQYLIDNNPDGRYVPTAHAAWSDYSGTEGDKWWAIQWIDVDELEPTRADESRLSVSFRVLVFGRDNDPMAVLQLADDFAELLHNTTVTINDRTDGTTERGKLLCDSVQVLPPTRDERDIVLAVADVPHARAYLN